MKLASRKFQWGRAGTLSQEVPEKDPLLHQKILNSERRKCFYELYTVNFIHVVCFVLVLCKIHVNCYVHKMFVLFYVVNLSL